MSRKHLGRSSIPARAVYVVLRDALGGWKIHFEGVDHPYLSHAAALEDAFAASDLARQTGHDSTVMQLGPDGVFRPAERPILTSPAVAPVQRGMVRGLFTRLRSAVSGPR